MSDTETLAATEDLVSLRFGRTGNAGACLRAGWAAPENDFTWGVGEESALVLPAPVGDAPLLLALHVAPFVVADRLPRQRLRVLVNGIAVADETLAEARTLAVILPDEALAAHGDVTITLRHPDHARARDLGLGEDARELAVAVVALRLTRIVERAAPAGIAYAATQLPKDREVLLAFESLGDTPEFGLVQRRAGADPLGLLRFSAAPFDRLMDLLQRRLDGIGDPALLGIDDPDSGESHVVRQRRYGIALHTLVGVSQMSAERALRREIARLTIAERRLRDHLALGDRILVYASASDLPDESLIAMFLALRDYGPSTLLHVTAADGDHPAGSVEVLLDGLMRGRVSRFAAAPAFIDADDACWHALCRRAYASWSSTRAAPLALVS